MGKTSEKEIAKHIARTGLHFPASGWKGFARRDLLESSAKKVTQPFRQK
jgi:hypothetical protein